MNENNSNDLQSIITQAIEEMKSEQGDKFNTSGKWIPSEESYRGKDGLIYNKQFKKGVEKSK